MWNFGRNSKRRSVARSGDRHRQQCSDLFPVRECLDLARQILDALIEPAPVPLRGGIFHGHRRAHRRKTSRAGACLGEVPRIDAPPRATSSIYARCERWPESVIERTSRHCDQGSPTIWSRVSDTSGSDVMMSDTAVVAGAVRITRSAGGDGNCVCRAC
jgi:hypothetical protein